MVSGQRRFEQRSSDTSRIKTSRLAWSRRRRSTSAAYRDRPPPRPDDWSQLPLPTVSEDAAISLVRSGDEDDDGGLHRHPEFGRGPRTRPQSPSDDLLGLDEAMQARSPKIRRRNARHLRRIARLGEPRSQRWDSRYEPAASQCVPGARSREALEGALRDAGSCPNPPSSPRRSPPSSRRKAPIGARRRSRGAWKVREPIRALERDQTILIETLALFIRYHLSVTTPVPEAHQEAARAQGRARFQQFIEQLARHLQRGGSLVKDVSRGNLSDGGRVLWRAGSGSVRAVRTRHDRRDCARR